MSKKGAFVLMFKARDLLQTKTKHYNMIFEPVIYIITIKLSFRIKRGFCALVDNSQSECQTRIKDLTSLKATGKKIQQRFSSAEYLL